MAGSSAASAGAGLSALNLNRGIQITDNNTLYIADKDNHRIVIILPNSTTAAATLGTGSGAGANQFNKPTDVFVADTSIYVLDANNYRIQRWPKDGSNTTTVAGITGTAGVATSLTTFAVSQGMFVDTDGYFYVSDQLNHRVLRFPPDSTSGTSSVMVAGTGTAGAAASQLNNPYRIFVDSDKSIYIADQSNNRIQRWTYGACFGVTVAGTGTAGTIASQLNLPSSVIVDSNQVMYIGDQYNNRIHRWAVGDCVGQCLVGCTQTYGTAIYQFYFLQNIAFDSQGALYVSDGANHRVQKFGLIKDFGK